MWLWNIEKHVSDFPSSSASLKRSKKYLKQLIALDALSINRPLQCPSSSTDFHRWPSKLVWTYRSVCKSQLEPDLQIGQILFYHRV